MPLRPIPMEAAEKSSRATAHRLLTRISRLRAPLWFALSHPWRLPHLARRALTMYREGRLQAIDERLEVIARHGTRVETGAAYRRWLRRMEASEHVGARQISDDIARLDDPPLISVLMPVYEPRVKWLNRAIRSVLAQHYPHWELCIADDASRRPAVARALRAWQRRDARIRVVFRDANGHISRASNSALTLARGAFVALLDHDDELPPDALYWVAREIRAHPDAALIYSDEDKIDTRGRRYGHYFKPDFSPDLLCSHNLISHLGVYRRELLTEIGGFRVGFEGSQDYDLALRVLERAGAERIHHISRVLYHWRAIPQSAAARGLEAKPYTLNAAIRAVEGHLRRTGRDATVTESPLAALNLRVRPRASARTITLIVAWPDERIDADVLLHGLRHDLARAGRSLLLVHPRHLPPPTSACATLACADGSSHAAMWNHAARHADGDLLLFLHRECQPLNRDWLDELAAHAAQPGIGAVGAKLYDERDRILSAGVVVGLHGSIGHAMRGQPRNDPGYNARAMLIQNYSAVSGACLALRRANFEEIGGFDATHLPDALHDIDLCLRLRERGLRTLWTPHAELRLPERALDVMESTIPAAQRAWFATRWADYLARDPAYHPKLTRDREDFSLREPAAGHGDQG